MQKSLVIFFGKTGAGKSYAAKMFAEEFGYYFYDADLDLTDEMREAIVSGQVFTDGMRSRYFEIIQGKTKELLKLNLKVALAQGFFKNKNRSKFSEAFPFAKFIWVDADDLVLEQRILERNSSVTLEYARKINQLFEPPDFSCEKLFNNQG
ncbi:MAG: AAA family ATPase, partial [Bacteroidota bacterium]